MSELVLHGPITHEVITRQTSPVMFYGGVVSGQHALLPGLVSQHMAAWKGVLDSSPTIILPSSSCTNGPVCRLCNDAGVEVEAASQRSPDVLVQLLQEAKQAIGIP